MPDSGDEVIYLGYIPRQPLPETSTQTAAPEIPSTRVRSTNPSFRPRPISTKRGQLLHDRPIDTPCSSSEAESEDSHLEPSAQGRRDTKREVMWDAFCQWIVSEYGHLVPAKDNKAAVTAQ